MGRLPANRSRTTGYQTRLRKFSQLSPLALNSAWNAAKQALLSRFELDLQAGFSLPAVQLDEAKRR